MAKYGKKAQQEVKKAMHEYKSGGSKHIQSEDQAVAVGLENARKAGAKVPSKKDS